MRTTPSAEAQFRGLAGPGRTSLTYLSGTIYLGRRCPLAAPARTPVRPAALLGKRIWVAHHLQAPAPRATVLAQVEEDGRGQGGIRERFPVRVPTAWIFLFVPGTRATSISGEIVKADEGFGLGVLLGILLLGSSRNILVHPPASRPRSEQVAEGKMLREAGALSGVKPRWPWAEQGYRGKRNGLQNRAGVVRSQPGSCLGSSRPIGIQAEPAGCFSSLCRLFFLLPDPEPAGKGESEEEEEEEAVSAVVWMPLMSKAIRNLTVSISCSASKEKVLAFGLGAAGRRG